MVFSLPSCRRVWSTDNDLTMPAVELDCEWNHLDTAGFQRAFEQRWRAFRNTSASHGAVSDGPLTGDSVIADTPVVTPQVRLLLSFGH